MKDSQEPKSVGELLSYGIPFGTDPQERNYVLALHLGRLELEPKGARWSSVREAEDLETIRQAYNQLLDRYGSALGG